MHEMSRKEAISVREVKYQLYATVVAVAAVVYLFRLGRKGVVREDIRRAEHSFPHKKRVKSKSAARSAKRNKKVTHLADPNLRFKKAFVVAFAAPASRSFWAREVLNGDSQYRRQ